VPLPAGVRLLGILRQGDTRRALLATPELPKGAWVQVGHDIAGWRLLEIGEDMVGLTAGKQVHQLSLHVPSSAAAADQGHAAASPNGQ
jgi:hypothetical protein